MQRIHRLILKIIVDNKGKGKENLIKAIFLFISVCVSSIIYIYRDCFQISGEVGYLGIFILSIIGNSTVVLPAPVFLTAFLGGSLFNPLLVGLISALGTSVGEMTGYLAGYGSGVLIKENKFFTKIHSWMQKRGFLTIFVLAAIPNPLFDLAGFSAGYTNYPLGKFFIATFLGKSVKFIAISLIGYMSL